MIDLVNFSFDFGGRYLFRETSWQIRPGERIGLIGQNGTGKSTLLRVISGEYSITGGTFSKAKDVTIGFLNQDLLSYNSSDSILKVAMGAFARVLELEQELAAVYERMATDHSDAVMKKLSDLQTEFDSLDGYNIHHRTEEVLEGLGFITSDLNRPLQQFSGGWRMRVMLAKLLLQEPSVLLLDEPTNHLDLPSIEWLEEYLQDYAGTVIVVSHDRFFLDRMVNRIVHVTGQKLVHYAGNYSDFLEAKEEREEVQQKAYENQQNYIRQQERFIQRFKAKASKATAAQSRQKMLDKLDRVEAVQDDSVEINLRFEVGQQSGKVVSRLENVSKDFGPELPILDHSTAEIVRGDHIALIGANGRGKSTLLRMIHGNESYKGKVETGHNVHAAFYAQHQLESLNLNNAILEELRIHAPDKTDQELRTVLGCFLFTGEDVFKKVKVLSGGEKARVALAKTLLTKANFLLLDEPTNHLDMQSINILVQALQQYKGTFIVVSHDRYFISRIATKIWWIEQLKLKEYAGTYNEFIVWDEERKETIGQQKDIPAVKPKTQEPEKPKQASELDAVKKELSKTEEELETTRAACQELERKMAQPEMVADFDKLNGLNSDYTERKKQLVLLEQRFEELFEKLLSLEEKKG